MSLMLRAPRLPLPGNTLVLMLVRESFYLFANKHTHTRAWAHRGRNAQSDAYACVHVCACVWVGERTEKRVDGGRAILGLF
jgi:hypothetical protein